MRLLDLITDEKTGKLSTTKIWMHVANATMTHVMYRQEAITWELMAAYGAIVGGSYVGGKFLRMRYGNEYSSTKLETDSSGRRRAVDVPDRVDG